MLWREKLIGTLLLRESGGFFVLESFEDSICLNPIHMTSNDLHLCLSYQPLLRLVHLSIMWTVWCGRIHGAMLIECVLSADVLQLRVNRELPLIPHNERGLLHDLLHVGLDLIVMPRVLALVNRLDPVLHRESGALLQIRLDVRHLLPHLVLTLVRLDLVQGHVDVLSHGVLLRKEGRDEGSLTLLAL